MTIRTIHWLSRHLVFSAESLVHHHQQASFRYLEIPPASKPNYTIRVLSHKGRRSEDRRSGRVDLNLGAHACTKGVSEKSYRPASGMGRLYEIGFLAGRKKAEIVPDRCVCTLVR